MSQCMECETIAYLETLQGVAVPSGRCMYHRLDDAMAEVARLREALERIRAVHASGVGDIGKARRMDDIARAALAAGKREGG